MAYWPVLLTHIFAAAVGLLAGFMAMTFRKGSGLHAASGTVFAVSMVIATTAGFFLAAFIRPNAGNVMGSMLTFYLVVTSWMTVRRRDGKANNYDLALLVFAFAIVGLGAMWFFEAIGSATRSKSGYPAPFFVVFGTIALLFAISDVRMIRRGGYTSNKRLARHLFRMCLGLFFATMSFYPGQAKIFPMWLRGSGLMFIPHILLVGGMLFHMVRVRSRKRALAITESHHEAIATVIAA
jgi:hypothetical protein